MKVRITGSNGQIYVLAVQGIIKTWLSVTFWTSFVTMPVTVWTIWQWIKPFIENRPF